MNLLVRLYTRILYESERPPPRPTPRKNIRMPPSPADRKPAHRPVKLTLAVLAGLLALALSWDVVGEGACALDSSRGLGMTGLRGLGGGGWGVSSGLGVRAIGQSPLRERTPPHSVLATLRLRSRLGGSATGRTEFPALLDSRSGVGWVWRGATDWWVVGRPSLDPSTVLRVSGPASGDGFTLRKRRTFSTAYLRPVSEYGNGPP